MPRTPPRVLADLERAIDACAKRSARTKSAAVTIGKEHAVQIRDLLRVAILAGGVTLSGCTAAGYAIANFGFEVIADAFNIRTAIVKHIQAERDWAADPNNQPPVRDTR